jgi:hypothetical protein
MNVNFSGTEKVLFKATVDFLMKYESLTEAQANEKAMYKIIAVRTMVKKTRFRH